MPLSTIFKLHVYRGGQFLLVGKTGVPRENQRKVSDKLYHIMWYQVHLAMNGIQTHNDLFEGELLVHKNRDTYFCFTMVQKG